jgi:V/A-type H+/Na+-transporting ATPase subunit E
MTEDLQSLLDRIRSEGVERAEAEAARIIQKAEERAAGIVAAARDEAASLRRSAEADATASLERGTVALEQAGRDFLLSLRLSIEAVLRETLREGVAVALTPGVMADILTRLADAYAAHDMNESRVDVLLSREDRDAVGAIVMEKYRDLVGQGLALRPDERVDAGFKVSFAEDNLYHDFTAEALAEALAPVLKPTLNEIVRRAAVEQG